MPPKSIPTFSNDDIARMGFIYAGGEYWGKLGKEVMTRRHVYAIMWVPKQIAGLSDCPLPRRAGQTVAPTGSRRPTAAPAGPTYLNDPGLRGIPCRYPRAAARCTPGIGRTAIGRNSDSARARARTHLDRRPRAGRLPAQEQPHDVAGHGQAGRSDLRQLRPHAGAVCRSHPVRRHATQASRCST